MQNTRKKTEKKVHRRLDEAIKIYFIKAINNFNIISMIFFSKFLIFLFSSLFHFYWATMRLEAKVECLSIFSEAELYWNFIISIMIWPICGKLIEMSHHYLNQCQLALFIMRPPSMFVLTFSNKQTKMKNNGRQFVCIFDHLKARKKKSKRWKWHFWNTIKALQKVK